MVCVSCGHCCKTMSPINFGYCPLLKEENTGSGTVYFCSDYKNRPDECKSHNYPAKVCPIGAKTIGIINELILSQRMADVSSVLNQKSTLPF